MAETQENIYIPGKQLIKDMGESKIIKILKSEEIRPTELEKFAEEVAEKWNLDFKEVYNGMQVGSWMYCYSREGKNGLYEINYDFLCFAEQEGVEIPVEQAVKRIEENLAKNYFGEDLWLQDKYKRLYIRQAPNLIEPGKYTVRENGKHIGKYNLKQLRILFSQVF